MRAGAGFTLIELIVVLAIFAVFAVLAYSGLDSVLAARARVERSLASTAALQKAYVRLRNDFQQLRARPIRDGFGESQPALLTTREGALEFTRGGWRNPLAQPRSSLERVAYRIDDDKRLVRASWRVLDRAQESRSVDLVVLDGVESLAWRFLDSQRQWHTTWPAVDGMGNAVADPVPRAVELTVETAELGEVRLLFSAANASPKAAPGPPGQPPPAGSGT